MEPLQKKTEQPEEGFYPQSELVTPIFLFICIGITTLAIGSVIYHWTTHFDFTDDEIKVEYMTPQKSKAFDASFSTPVHVGLTIKNFRKFDIPHNEFEFDGMLWFDFDPNVIAVSTVTDVSFLRGEILYKSKPVSYVHNGRLFLVYNDVRVNFNNPMNYKYFPVDDHRISLAMVNDAAQINELHYSSNNEDFIVNQNMMSSGWYKFGQRTKTGYTTTTFNDKTVMQPLVLFTMDYGRGRNTRNSMIIILPMLVLFFVALFLFASKKLDSRQSIPIQSLLGLVGYRFVLEALSPSVGYYMYVDYFFMLFLILIFVLVLIGSIKTVLHRNVSKLIIILLNALAIGMFWYFL